MKKYYTKEQITSFMVHISSKSRDSWTSVEKEQINEIADYLDHQTIDDLAEIHKLELAKHKTRIAPLSDEDLIPPIPKEAMVNTSAELPTKVSMDNLNNYSNISLLEDLVMSLHNYFEKKK